MNPDFKNAHQASLSIIQKGKGLWNSMPSQYPANVTSTNYRALILTDKYRLSNPAAIPSHV